MRVEVVDTHGTSLHYGDRYDLIAEDSTCLTIRHQGEHRRYKKSRFNVVVEQTQQQAACNAAAEVSAQQRAQSCRLPTEVSNNLRIPAGYPAWCKFLAAGGKLKFRSGCDVKFVAYVPDAKPHCQLVLLNPQTGNVVTRYANGKGTTEQYDEPGDILVA